MVHNAHWLLISLAVVALLGLTLTGCTANWSGSIELEVHGQAHTHSPAPAEAS